jgi:hypothetical protein
MCRIWYAKNLKTQGRNQRRSNMVRYQLSPDWSVLLMQFQPKPNKAFSRYTQVHSKIYMESTGSRIAETVLKK